MDERDRRRYNDAERDYYTNNDRRDPEPRRYPQQGYRAPSSYGRDDPRDPRQGYSGREQQRYRDAGYAPQDGGYGGDADRQRGYAQQPPAPQYGARDFDYDYNVPQQAPHYEDREPKKKKGLFSFKGKQDIDPGNIRNVIITYPRTYDDVRVIIDSLRGSQAIIVDLQKISDKSSQRILDFLSGAIYALGGSQQRINDNMFLFTPEGVMIQGPSSLKRKYD